MPGAALALLTHDPASERRRDSLSFGHHAEVAALPEAEQDYWLRKAEQLGWPVKRLRSQVPASHDERAAGDSSPGPAAHVKR